MTGFSRCDTRQCGGSSYTVATGAPRIFCRRGRSADIRRGQSVRLSEGEGRVAVWPGLVPLAADGDGVGRRQLAGVGREAGRRTCRSRRHRRRRPAGSHASRQLVGIARHAVQSLGQVRRSLQYYLLQPSATVHRTDVNIAYWNEKKMKWRKALRGDAKTARWL